MQVYATEVKKAILNSKFLFTGDDDKTSVLFEKEIDSQPGGHTIADCLIFSRSKGLIGVEIKTAHDSKARLRRQLWSYTRVCDYVWVFIHDTKLYETMDILEDYPQVGIICYNEINDVITPGIIREPQHCDNQLALAYDLSWATELWHLIKQMPSHGRLRGKRAYINFLVRRGKPAYQAYINQWIDGYVAPDRRFSVYDFKERR